MSASEWPQHSLERVARCPACSASERSPLHADLVDRVYRAPGTWTLHGCRECRSAYLDPRPSADALHLAYRSYYTHADRRKCSPRSRLGTVRRALRNGYLNSRYGYALTPSSALGALAMPLFPAYRERADRSIRQLRLSADAARLLDVGCGSGEFLVEMREAGWNVQGVEPDPAAAAQARKRGVPVEKGVLEETTFPDEVFDAVTLNHVVEHLPDPAQTLSICYGILRRGGVLSLTTPNLASTGHAIFGRDWIGLEPPRHLTLFTSASLAALLARLGFEVERQRPSCTTRWFLEASAAVARGADPHAPPPLPPGLRAKAWRADRRALRNPAAGEEIVLVARKPSDPG